MIALIILGVLALAIILGLCKPMIKDFRINAVIVIVFLLCVLGLNFIPTVNIGGFSFRVGTLIFYAGILLMFFIKGRFVNQMTALSIALILGGLAYAGICLSRLSDNNFFGEPNYVYAIIIGVLAMIFTRNGRYSFIAPAAAMLLVNLISQIGNSSINLDYCFDWTLVAVATGTLFYLVFRKVFTAKPNKMAYYFEAGKLGD